MPGQIIAACRSLGFALAGVTSAAASGFADELHAWLASGKHGEMAWLADAPGVRADPTQLLPGARSIIVVADRYASKHSPRQVAAAPPEAPDPDEHASDCSNAPHGRIARYARGLDYHVVMKRRLHTLADALRTLHPANEFRAFVDTAPMLEREHAARAGLGFIGKHTLLINPALGSYLLLGGLLTTLPLDAVSDASTASVIDDNASSQHCGSCTRCIDACPTQAITPYSVDARRCISYLTIEHKGPIDPSLHTPIGDWAFGCDVCQEVCPFNVERGAGVGSPASPTALGAPIHRAYAPTRDSFPLLEVLNWNDPERIREFTGTALKRITLDMLRRNAMIVLNNLG